jgi:hypothetical protein
MSQIKEPRSVMPTATLAITSSGVQITDIGTVQLVADPHPILIIGSVGQDRLHPLPV